MYNITTAAQALAFIEKQNCNVRVTRYSYEYQKKWHICVWLEVEDNKVEIVRTNDSIEDGITDAVATLQRLVHGKLASDFTGLLLTHEEEREHEEHRNAAQ